MKKNNPWYYILNGELIKEKKPCLDGDKVHIYSLEGCFNVIEVYLSFFTITKNRKIIKIKWDDFRCLKGYGTSELSLYRKKHNELHKKIEGIYMESLFMKKSLKIGYR